MVSCETADAAAEFTAHVEAAAAQAAATASLARIARRRNTASSTGSSERASDSAARALIPTPPGLSPDALRPQNGATPPPRTSLGDSLGECAMSASFALPVVETGRAVHRRTRKGKPVINNYVVDVELGEGKFSTVRLVRHCKTKKAYALKVIPRSRLAHLRLLSTAADRERLLRHEIAVLKRLRHPHIIALVEVIDDPVENNLYLVLELAEHGAIAAIDPRNGATLDAEGRPMRLDDADAAGVARALIAAIRYAHHNGVAHRDIKPENILRGADGELKLSDFGVAKMIDDWPEMASDAQELMLDPDLSPNVVHPTRDDPHSPTGRKVPSHETIGTPWFMSPEALSAAVRGIPEGIALDLSDLFLSDIWSFGVTMYALTVGCLPWTSPSTRGMAHSIAASGGVVPFPPDADVSEGLRDFLSCAIRVRPSERWSLRQLAHHPWVAGTPAWAAGAVPAPLPLANGYSFTPSFSHQHPSHSHGRAPGAAAPVSNNSDVGASAFSNFSFDYAGLAPQTPPPAAAAARGSGDNKAAGADPARRSLLSPDDADEVDALAGRHEGRGDPSCLTDSFAGQTVRVDNTDLQEALASVQGLSVSAEFSPSHLDGSASGAITAQPSMEQTHAHAAASPADSPSLRIVEHHEVDEPGSAAPTVNTAPSTPPPGADSAPTVAALLSLATVTPPAAVASSMASSPGVAGTASLLLSPHAMSTTQIYENNNNNNNASSALPSPASTARA